MPVAKVVRVIAAVELVPVEYDLQVGWRSAIAILIDAGCRFIVDIDSTFWLAIVAPVVGDVDDIDSAQKHAENDEGSVAINHPNAPEMKKVAYLRTSECVATMHNTVRQKDVQARKICILVGERTMGAACAHTRTPTHSHTHSQTPSQLHQANGSDSSPKRLPRRRRSCCS